MRAELVVFPMTTALNFTTEVEDTLAHGSVRQRSEMLRRVTDLFVVGSDRYSDGEIELFDDVIARLAAKIEVSARALLAARLAPITNAPPKIIRALAFDDVIDVAGPVLAQSERLDDSTLLEVAREKGQDHLFAISRRSSLSEAVTDILIERGDQQVALSTTENRAAKISDFGFSALVRRAEGDDRLAICVGARPEIPPHLFVKLLAKASQAVRAKLEAAHPNAEIEVHHAVAEAASHLHAEQIEQSRGYAAAKAFVEPLYQSGQLDDGQFTAFANADQFEKVVTGLALSSQLSLQFVERAMLQERSDTLLILAKSVGLSWPTVKAILSLRVVRRIVTATEISRCLASFERLKVATAQEIIRYYRRREGTGSHRSH